MTTVDRPAEDLERAQVYAAERAAFGGTLHERQRPFDELAQVARALVEGAWWPGPGIVLRRARVDARRSSTVDRAGGIGPAPGPGAAMEIRLAVGQFDEVTLCHELAHVLAGVACGHDGRFRTAHVDLAGSVLGGTAASWLAQAYRDHGLALDRRSWPMPSPLSSPGLGPIAL